MLPSYDLLLVDALGQKYQYRRRKRTPVVLRIHMRRQTTSHNLWNLVHDPLLCPSIPGKTSFLVSLGRLSLRNIFFCIRDNEHI